MKDFQTIDWKIYNNPPYWQQWLCRDDTLKLATFGDKGLAEIDGRVIDLKDQWDLEKVKDYFLDRIGKLLKEHRNGGTDDHYRMLLKLRTLLNTSDGSIPSIIKTIKFLYSSEVVHIVPDYPAGLIIEHDGEGTPGLNFNKILAEIVPAGVNYSTKELFNFFEEILFSDDLPDLRVVRADTDRFGIQVKYNGVLKYDGHTINDTVWIYSKYDGLHKYDGTSKYNGVRKTAREYPVRTAFKYSSRTADTQTLAVQLDAAETVTLSDLMWFLLRVVYEDTVGMDEAATVAVKTEYQETIPSADAAEVAVRLQASESVAMAESTVMGMRYHHAFDGQYKYDGKIAYDSTVLHPLAG